jgi:hypothetical protein
LDLLNSYRSSLKAIILGSGSRKTHVYIFRSHDSKSRVSTPYSSCLVDPSGKLLLVLASTFIPCSGSRRTHDNIFLSYKGVLRELL